MKERSTSNLFIFWLLVDFHVGPIDFHFSTAQYDIVKSICLVHCCRVHLHLKVYLFSEKTDDSNIKFALTMLLLWYDGGNEFDGKIFTHAKYETVELFHT